MNPKEIILGNIIGINPTGTLSYEGTYQLNGSNNIVRDSNSAAKDSLKKSDNNEIICGSIEKFENYKKEEHNKFLILFIILLIFLLICIFFFYCK